MIRCKPRPAKLRWTVLLAGLTSSLVPLVSAAGQSSAASSAGSASPAAYVPRFTFDVASIRDSQSEGFSYTMTLSMPPHTSAFAVTNFTVMDILTMAFGVKRFEVSGGPDWLGKARFNIQAKSDSSVDEALGKLNQEQAWAEKQHMLQVLLANRFQLTLHPETKERPGFALTLGRSGSRLQPAQANLPPASQGTALGRPGSGTLEQKCHGLQGCEFIGRGASLKMLAENLSYQFGATIVDRTGLTGGYDFNLQYRGVTAGDEAEDDPSAWAPLARAIPDQLGLRLESIKAPARVLVIDHVEKPSAN